jgi:hypothetical protein
MRLRLQVLPFSVTLLLATGGALAQSTPPDARSASVASLVEATRLAAAGNAAEACAKYAESYSLDAQLDALLPLADCLEQSGKLASAYAAFRDAVDVAQRAGDGRSAKADERAQRLRPRLSYLTIEVLQARRLPALSVERDGFRLGSSGWGVPAPVDPGKHLVSVSAYGYRTWETVVDVQGDGSLPYVEVPLLQKLPDEQPAPAEVVPAVVEPAAPAPVVVVVAPTARVAPRRTRPVAVQGAPPRRLSPVRVAALTAGGVGIVSLGVGVYFLSAKNSTLSERDGICPSSKNCAPGTNAHLAELTHEAIGQQRTAIALLALGGATIALGAGLWFWPKAADGGDHAAFLLPVVAPSGGGLVLGGRL